MKILFVTQTAHPWGGVEVWLEYLSNGLAARGHDVTVGLVRGRRFHDPARYLAARKQLPKTIEIPALTGTREGRVRALVRAFRRVQPDVVVLVNIVDVLEAARRHPVRVLYALHSSESNQILDVRSNRDVISAVAATGRLAARAVDGLYAPCGVPPPWSAAAPAAAFRIVFAGRLTQTQKRVRDLIPLLASLDLDFTLDIAGDGEELPYLRSALAHDPRVRFLGLLSRDELYERVYPGASAMLILSEWETGPIVAWEAMRHGATLVTTRYRGLTAEGTIRHEENALVGDVGEGIRRLAADPALLRRLQQGAKATADREYTIERSIDAWEGALPLRSPMESGSSRYRTPKESVLETLRGILGRGMIHSEPGGEWPHTEHLPSPEVDAEIAELDR